MNNPPLTIHFSATERRVVLAGTLDGSPAAFAECERVFLQIGRQQGQWIIDASNVLLPSGGAATWIRAVNEYLNKCQLNYLPCQLASVLQHTKRYTHPRSSFGEAGYSSAEAPRAACATPC